jgi:hypothetical protein
MTAMMWFVVPVVAVALLAFSLFKRFADDRFEALTERLRNSSRLVSRAQLVEGTRHLEVALALTDSSVIYESADGQSSVDRQWIQEVGYESELSTGQRVVDGKVLRLRCFSKTFEFVLSPSVVREWESILPAHRMLTAST